MENENKGRFYLFNDKELYMLKKACVEAAKYLLVEMVILIMN